MLKESEIDKKLLHDFHLLDEYGQKTIMDILANELERCMQQDKETRKKAFEIIK